MQATWGGGGIAKSRQVSNKLFEQSQKGTVMDTLSAMRAFRQVVAAGGFAAAGRQVGRATSSVSRQIAELEATLGVSLLNRTTRSVSLTEAGEIYYDRAVRILEDVDAANLAVTQAEDQPTGVLRLTIPTAVGREVITAALPGFLERFPGIRIALSATDSLVDLFEERIDVAVRIGRLRDSSLMAAKVAESRRVCVASPTYLTNHGTPDRPEDLQQHNCLTYRAHPGSNSWTFRGPDGAIKVPVTGNMFVLSAEALAAAAIAGIGIVLLPDWCVGEELRTGRLKAILPDYQPTPDTSPIYAVYPPTSHLAPKVRVFIDYLRKNLVR